MSVAESLLDIGDAMAPSVLSDCFEGEAMSPLDAMRRAACTKNTMALKKPPPALVHPSGFASSDFLYGTVHPAPFVDVTYKRQPELAIGNDGQGFSMAKTCLIGAVMIDVLENDDPCTCFLLWRECDRTLCAVAMRAPLGAMEADLGSPLRQPSAFEKLWLGEDAEDMLAFRRSTLSYIQRCGMDKFHPTLLCKSTAIERKGILPFLRMRKPKNVSEKKQLLDDLNRAAAEARAKNLPFEMKRPTDVLGPDMEPFRMTTVFCRDVPEQAPDASIETVAAPETRIDWEGFLQNPVIATLALSLMLKGVEPDYTSSLYSYKLPQGMQDVALSSRDNGLMREAMQRLSEQEIGEPVLQADMVGARVAPSQAIGRFLGMTQRTFELQLLVKFDSATDALAALAACLFRDEEPLVIAAGFKNSGARILSSNIVPRLRMVARSLDARFAILCVCMDKQGQITGVTLDAPNEDGHHVLGLDEMVRLLLCPWVTPLVIKDRCVDRISIGGVAREKLRLSNEARKSFSSNMQAATKTDVAQIRSELHEGLEQVKASAEKRSNAQAFPTVMSEGAEKLKEILPVLRAKCQRGV